MTPKQVKNRERMRVRNSTIIRALKDKPCKDCKECYPYYVMDFDHVRGKKLFTLGNSIRGYSVQQLLAEAAKCDVVCSNCHRKRTQKRKDAARAIKTC